MDLSIFEAWKKVIFSFTELCSTQDQDFIREGRVFLGGAKWLRLDS